jgi:hypothetical protein
MPDDSQEEESSRDCSTSNESSEHLEKRPRLITEAVDQTQSLRENPPGYVRMDAGDKSVSLRKSDFWLNAT